MPDFAAPLQRLIDEDDLRGLTSNPTIFDKAIAGSDDYDAQLDLSQRAFGIYTAQQAASWLHVARLRPAEEPL